VEVSEVNVIAAIVIFIGMMAFSITLSRDLNRIAKAMENKQK